MYQDIKKITTDLFEQANKLDFAGYDPFDGLNSKLFSCSKLHNSFLGLVWIQFFKRSPFKIFRKILIIPKTRNPKGVSLFILVTIYSLKIKYDKRLCLKIIELAEWLILSRSDKNNWNYSSWGYNFPWKARAFYVPKGKPNLITSVFVGRSLIKLSIFLQEKYLP